jgi:hypothetical protein
VLRLTEPRSAADSNGARVFWHTQGFWEILFDDIFCALRKLPGNWPFGRL